MNPGMSLQDCVNKLSLMKNMHNMAKQVKFHELKPISPALIDFGDG